MGSMRRALLAALAAALAFASAPAYAFCRTTTDPIPAGYDPTVRGCITAGTPLQWPSMPVTYQMQEQASTQVSLAEATTIFDRSFAKWAAASCAESGGAKAPDLSFQDVGPTTAGFTPCDGGACEATARSTPHVIIFRDSAWPYNDPSNTLALTTVTFGVDTGNLYAADVEINTHEHQVSTSVPPPTGTFSLEAIATHEAGHFIGVAHSQIATAIMYAHYQAGATKLTTDDVDAVCSIYPPATPSSKGCACSSAPRSGGANAATAMGIGVLLLVSRGARRSRRARLKCRP